MRFRRMLVALAACVVLSAVGVNAAQAALHWTVNGSELTGSESVHVSGGPWTLTATTLGVEVELTAEIVECSPGESCTISSSGKSSGALTYTNATVMKPAHCTVASVGAAVGTISTKGLVDQIIMDPSNGAGPVFDKFTPASGTTLAQIEFHGGECALNEFALPVSGSVTGQSPNATGVEKAEQMLTFGSAQQATGGGALTLGGGTAVLTGTAVNALSGSRNGQKFGATE